MLRIYGRANSINVRKVLWTADEIGIPYEREDWARGVRPLDDPEFLAINPFGLVPAIDDDGFALGESHAIIRYLAASRSRAAYFKLSDRHSTGFRRPHKRNWHQLVQHFPLKAAVIAARVRVDLGQDAAVGALRTRASRAGQR